MYKVISLISKYYRDNVIENPLEYSILLIFIAPLFHLITYKTTGLFYDNSKHLKSFGSFLYLVFFIMNTKVISLYFEYQEKLIIPICVTILYAVLIVRINDIWNRIFYY